MKHLLLAVLLLGTLALAQDKPATKADTAAGAPDAALLQKVWDAWNTLDPANAAQYYDQNSGDIFFDIAPLQYHGWKEYEPSSKKMINDMFKEVNCKVTQPRVHPFSSLMWATAIVHCDTVMKDDSKSPMDMRWTSVWRKMKDNWLIVHEHISAPLPEQPSGGARPAKGPKKQ